jgi:hypothetical protein
MHDSRAAIPLSLMSAARVTNFYDLMDAAHCSLELHEHCRSLGHLPLIDHNPRGGEKDKFEPPDAVRYNERTVAELSNARLNDEFGGRNVMVRGHTQGDESFDVWHPGLERQPVDAVAAVTACPPTPASCYTHHQSPGRASYRSLKRTPCNPPAESTRIFPILRQAPIRNGENIPERL